jgi:hypothetical protein
MATILHQSAVPDGYEAKVRLLDGRETTWHWLSKPANVQTAVERAESKLRLAEIEDVRRAERTD